MQTPLQVVVRKVAGDHDVMGLFSAAPEIAVKHYPCPWANRFHTRSSRACDIEALDDHMMRRLQKDHPIPVAFAGAVDDTVARLTHRLEMNVVVVTCIRFITNNKTRIGSGQYGDQIAAACCICCFLYGSVHSANRILPCDSLSVSFPLGKIEGRQA